MSLSHKTPTNNRNKGLYIPPIKTLLLYAGYLVISGLITGLIGYFYSKKLPILYTSTARLLPEFSSSNSGSTGLNDLASLAGVSLRNKTDALRPDIYPDILQSQTFLISALSHTFTNQKKERIPLLSAINPKATKFSQSQVLYPDSLIETTSEQDRALSILSRRINVIANKSTGVISINVTMSDPRLAAGIAMFSIQYLQDFVNEYRSSKQFLKVQILTKQTEDARKNLQTSELKLSIHRDSHINSFTNTSRIQEQRLQSDFMQYQSIYGDIRRQLESAKLQLQEESSVLKILDYPTIPNKKSQPNTMLLILGFAATGILLVTFYLAIKSVISPRDRNQIS